MGKVAVIFCSVFLICTAIATSLSITLYFSWMTAQNIERDKLFEIAKKTIHRTRLGLNQAYQILNTLKNENIAPCSIEQLVKMRQLIFYNSYVQDIEYLDNNKIKCSALGIRDAFAAIPASGFELSNGVNLILNKSLASKEKDSIAFRDQNYNVLVDADLLTDVIVDSYIKIAVLLNNGELLSSSNFPNSELIKAVQKNIKLTKTNNELVTVSRFPDLYIITSEANDYLMKMWRRQLMLFLPFGLILCFLACGLIYFLSKRRLSPAGELKIAVKNKEFLVYYQPIIDIKTGQCHGAESLIRWQRPDGTVIRPDLFIPLAEETNLIQPITDQVIDRVIADMQVYFLADSNLHVAINISAEDFNSGRILYQLEKKLANTGIKRHQMWLEVTERGFINMQSCKEKIVQANNLGYIIVIDDFGTGYSSLSYLKELPLHGLKIDKSFINTVSTDAVTSSVTHYIIKIAKSLNLKIVAEGVETQAQADYLKNNEVEYAQGWLYAKAMPLKEFIDFYDHRISLNPESSSCLKQRESNA